MTVNNLENVWFEQSRNINVRNVYITSDRYETI